MLLFIILHPPLISNQVGKMWHITGKQSEDKATMLFLQFMASHPKKEENKHLAQEQLLQWRGY